MNLTYVFASIDLSGQYRDCGLVQSEDQIQNLSLQICMISLSNTRLATARRPQELLATHTCSQMPSPGGDRDVFGASTHHTNTFTRMPYACAVIFVHAYIYMSYYTCLPLAYLSACHHHPFHQLHLPPTTSLSISTNCRLRQVACSRQAPSYVKTGCSTKSWR